MNLEGALVSAEISSVDELEKNFSMLQNKIHRLEAQRNATRVMKENQQAKLKQSIGIKQDQLAKWVEIHLKLKKNFLPLWMNLNNGLETMLKNSPNDECLKEELRNTSDSLVNYRKTFEDLEFGRRI